MPFTDQNKNYKFNISQIYSKLPSPDWVAESLGSDQTRTQPYSGHCTLQNDILSQESKAYMLSVQPALVPPAHHNK